MITPLSSTIPIVGIIEPVSLTELGISEVLAKIDTGAYSGAIHCESIKVVKIDGKKALKVIPIREGAEEVTIYAYRKTYAKSSTGHRESRYIVDTPVAIQGEEYIMSVGLTVRDHMNFKVLIGRRFLRKHHILVDVTLNQELDDDGGRKL